MDAERGARGPRGPEAAGFEADENGSTEGELRELLAGAEAAMAVNLEKAGGLHQDSAACRAAPERHPVCM